jgi:3-methyl-2-oxobutanoate hydroxymethyltransferase
MKWFCVSQTIIIVNDLYSFIVFILFGSAPSAKQGGRPDSFGQKTMNLHRLMHMHASDEKIAMLTAYDATFAALAVRAGVDSLLIGDSLGMVCQGQSSTLGVTIEEVAYHTKSVLQGVQSEPNSAWVIADLPFGTYQSSKEQAMQSAAHLLQAGAHMVKLEGGGWTNEVVHFLTERGVLVCGHLGLTPQTVHALGGYKVQGREEQAARTLLKQAQELEQAGAQMLVLEMVPKDLAHEVTRTLKKCATIGIGAGNVTSGQVLVMHDMLGAGLGKMPKFVRNFLEGEKGIEQAMRAYVKAVKDQSFPDNALHAW